MNLRDSVRLHSFSSFRFKLSLSSACLNQRGFGSTFSKRKYSLTEVTGEFWREKWKTWIKISINTEISIHISSIQGISRLGFVCFMCKGKTLTIKNILSLLAFGGDCSKNNNNDVVGQMWSWNLNDDLYHPCPFVCLSVSNSTQMSWKKYQ